MTIFEAVKSTVTPRMAAEHFGLSVSRNGMACCPFHDDRHPSMKLNEEYFYFTEALDFIQKYQSKDTIISAVVHMDEKTPHMHLCFVPLTEDKRLSAKEIVGNKKKLTW